MTSHRPFVAFPKPLRAIWASQEGVGVTCKDVAKDGVWLVPPHERPAGWRTDPKFEGVREK